MKGGIHMASKPEKKGKSDEAIAEQVNAWISSPEGNAALEKAIADCDQTVAELNKKRSFKPSELLKTFGPVEGQ